MDETDIILVKLLWRNSRLSYRELAKHTGLSVSAVQKRIQSLVSSGIIRAFTAKISISALKALHVLIFGRTEAESIDEVNRNLKNSNDDFTYWVAIASGNHLYVGAYLRNISELQPYVSFLMKKAKMPDPTVGIVHSESGFPFLVTPRDVTLDSLDFQIIRVLQKNSRKLASEIAKELGISAKTVRRRLSKMVHEKSIELSIEWYPDTSGDMISILHLYMKPSTSRGVIDQLVEKYSPNTLFYWSFSNLPNLILCVAWTKTMRELQDLCRSFQSEKIFRSVVPNILYNGYLFDTWRDKLVTQVLHKYLRASEGRK